MCTVILTMVKLQTAHSIFSRGAPFLLYFGKFFRNIDKTFDFFILREYNYKCKATVKK